MAERVRFIVMFVSRVCKAVLDASVSNYSIPSKHCPSTVMQCCKRLERRTNINASARTISSVPSSILLCRFVFQLSVHRFGHEKTSSQLICFHQSKKTSVACRLEVTFFFVPAYAGDAVECMVPRSHFLWCHPLYVWLHPAQNGWVIKPRATLTCGRNCSQVSLRYAHPAASFRR